MAPKTTVNSSFVGSDTSRTERTAATEGENSQHFRDFKTRRKKLKNSQVRFSVVELREYDLCLGDNPSVRRGAPLSLDWGYKSPEQSIPIDCYERLNTNDINTRTYMHRSLQEIALPSIERLKILKELGYSMREINQAINETQNIRQQRIRTRRQVERLERLHVMIRKLRSLFSCYGCHVHDSLANSSSTALTESEWSASTNSTNCQEPYQIEEQYPVVSNKKSRRRSGVHRVSMAGDIVKEAPKTNELSTILDPTKSIDVCLRKRGRKGKLNPLRQKPRDSLERPLNKRKGSGGNWPPKPLTRFHWQQQNKAENSLDLARHGSVRLDRVVISVKV